MKRPLLPSFTSIRCFEASARHLSFTRAAEEIKLTQSAVSKQVAQLEAILERPLFLRVRKRLQLSPEGAIYLAEARNLLLKAEIATRRMRSFSGGREELHISTLPTFGSRWLIPNLNGFRFVNPKIDLNIRCRVDTFEFSEENIDIAFFFGHGAWPDAKCVRLMGGAVMPVCSPSLLPDEPLQSPLDLTRFVLLHTSTRPESWHDWFEAQGLQTSNSYYGPRFETFEMSLEAARAGCGVALIPDFLVSRELVERQVLTIPWHFTHHGTDAYYMAYPEHKAESDRVKHFVDWIQSRIPSGNQVDSAEHENN